LPYTRIISGTASPAIVQLTDFALRPTGRAAYVSVRIRLSGEVMDTGAIAASGRRTSAAAHRAARLRAQQMGRELEPFEFPPWLGKG
jgi:hypothetical protein